MFQLQSYLDRLISKCRSAFGDRLLYVGLQGSYLCGEAHEDSDIDVMLVIDRLTVDDMRIYQDILKQIGCYEKSCGFICGGDELKHWNPLEVCQLRHTTKDLFGCLTDYLPRATRTDEINYVKYSLGNLYHELCHRYIHADREKNRNKFRTTGKGIFFLLQNLHYLESGVFAVTKKELRTLVSAEDRIVLSMADLPEEYDFERMFRIVFEWIRSAFLRIDRIEP
jgi:Nucleotidyltransferase domain.